MGQLLSLSSGRTIDLDDVAYLKIEGGNVLAVVSTRVKNPLQVPVDEMWELMHLLADLPPKVVRVIERDRLTKEERNKL